MTKLVIAIGLLLILLAGLIISVLVGYPARRNPIAAIPVQTTNSEPAKAGTTNISPKPAPPESGAVAPAKPSLPEGAALTQITFDSPQENESVPRTFQVSGHCGPVAPGQHLLLAIQTGNVFSPKWPPIKVDGDTWTGRAMEYGVRSGGAFTLCVFQVDDAGVDEISRWDAEGLKTRRWPPFREIPGGTLLTSMNLRVAVQPKP